MSSPSSLGSGLTTDEERSRSARSSSSSPWGIKKSPKKMLTKSDFKKIRKNVEEIAKAQRIRQKTNDAAFLHRSKENDKRYAQQQEKLRLRQQAWDIEDKEAADRIAKVQENTEKNPENIHENYELKLGQMEASSVEDLKEKASRSPRRVPQRPQRPQRAETVKLVRNPSKIKMFSNLNLGSPKRVQRGSPKREQKKVEGGKKSRRRCHRR